MRPGVDAAKRTPSSMSWRSCCRCRPPSPANWTRHLSSDSPSATCVYDKSVLMLNKTSQTTRLTAVSKVKNPSWKWIVRSCGSQGQIYGPGKDAQALRTLFLFLLLSEYFRQEAQLLLGDRATRKHAKDS